jgi:uncharacterized ferredoxin-like protein
MDGAIHTAAELMALAARTAPKALGQDHIDIEIVDGDALRKLGERMIDMKDRHPNFERDGKNVLGSIAVLLIGLRDHPAVGLNCRGCGYDCKGMESNQVKGDFDGPSCALRLIDLGIAIGSAVKMASILNVDNRVMYRIGVAAKELGTMDSKIIMGIPLCATGKSPFFDR